MAIRTRKRIKSDKKLKKTKNLIKKEIDKNQISISSDNLLKSIGHNHYTTSINSVDKNKNIEISFILGILNAERTLRECLESIFNQDFKKEKYEVIIVDGGSTDKTLPIIKEFMEKYDNIKLFHNPNKLSEGRGMSKDLGTKASKGEIVIFLDHDNILIGKEWLKEIIEPFNKDKEIMASQSLLQFMENDTNFLKYVNAVGVEDPFAIPYSLPAQIVLHPEKFKIIDGKYYIHHLDKNNLVYGGANGCAFRKSVFDVIGGYTRDVDIFASMAEQRMKVAVPLNPRVYHKTASNLLNYMIKKGLYFYRFIDHEYEKKTFKWTQRGSGLKGKINFFLMIAHNLSFFGPLFIAFSMFIKTKRLFWLLHPFYLFFITLEYGLITLFKIRNFFKYQKK
ncbi:glycosyltransferase [Candidatus Pacearchaeota archaeon]|nr:glycosyltransferase [Candidatus Pacearchaeota archaeon]